MLMWRKDGMGQAEPDRDEVRLWELPRRYEMRQGTKASVPAMGSERHQEALAAGP